MSVFSIIVLSIACFRMMLTPLAPFHNTHRASGLSVARAECTGGEGRRGAVDGSARGCGAAGAAGRDGETEGRVGQAPQDAGEEREGLDRQLLGRDQPRVPRSWPQRR